MKKFTKIFAVALLGVMFSLTLFGCNDTNPSSGGDTPPEEGNEEVVEKYGEITVNDLTFTNWTSKVEAFHYGENDESYIYGKLYLPKNYQSGKLPTFIFSNGADTDNTGSAHFCRWLAGVGFACYSYDSRGGSSTGQSYGAGIEATSGATWQSRVDDVKTVVSHIKTLDCVDTDHIYAVGISAGGAGTAWASVDIMNDVEAIVLFYPAIHTQSDRNAMFAEFTKPVLLLHGTADDIVPIESSRTAVTLFPNARLIEFPGQTHYFEMTEYQKAIVNIYNFVRPMLNAD